MKSKSLEINETTTKKCYLCECCNQTMNRRTLEIPEKRIEVFNKLIEMAKKTEVYSVLMIADNWEKKK